MSLQKASIELIPESIQLIKMSDEVYFSDEYKDYVSNSKLGLFNPDEGGSIEKFEAGFKSGYSESFELGGAVHAMILQPDFYRISDIRKPSGKLGVFAEKVLNHRRNGLTIAESINLASTDAAYYASSFSVNRQKTAIKKSLAFYLQRYKVLDEIDSQIETLYLSDAMAFKYDKCMCGIASNPKIKETFYPQGLLQPAEFYNEYAILAEVKVTVNNKVIPLKIKAKLDNFTVNHETQELTLNDLKTTGKPVSFFMGNNVKLKDEEGKDLETRWFDGSFQKYRYYRQMGMYLWLLACYMQTKGINYKAKANMVVVETIPEFQTKIYSVNNRDITKGINEFKNLLTQVAEWIEQK